MSCLLSSNAAQRKTRTVTYSSHAIAMQNKYARKKKKAKVSSKRHRLDALQKGNEEVHRVHSAVLVVASVHSVYSASSFLWSCTPQLLTTAHTLVLRQNLFPLKLDTRHVIFFPISHSHRVCADSWHHSLDSDPRGSNIRKRAV